ncbi:hypothetical protein MLD38_038089 [Melastoma candidum]|uniref:Uncharacterized protein n=1 Tax=Melastoma candidum TaxID=119954 RepID=A0ACB9KZA4_9MYRT|nr:hypothetical protein MLD38_038089 [Melastoma candidum]
MHLWPSKKVKDFFTASHLDFLERNRMDKRQSLLLKQNSRSRSFNGYNREVAGDGEAEGEREGGGGGGYGFWKEMKNEDGEVHGMPALSSDYYGDGPGRHNLPG